MSHIFDVVNVVSDMLAVLYPTNDHGLAMLIYGCTSDLLDFALT
jgi:hypothetical protein